MAKTRKFRGKTLWGGRLRISKPLLDAGLDDKKIMQMVKFACRSVPSHKDHGDDIAVSVKLYHRGGATGMAYFGVPSMASWVPPTCTRLITIRVPHLVHAESIDRDTWDDWKLVVTSLYTIQNARKQPMSSARIYSMVEPATEEMYRHLLRVTAHEAMHVHQYRLGLPRSEVWCRKWEEQVCQQWKDRFDRADQPVVALD